MNTKKTTINWQSTDASIMDIYNLLMFDIEPDLTTNHLEIAERELELMSEEERKKKMEHYAEAWDTFAARFEKISEKQMESLKNIEAKVKKMTEKQERNNFLELDSLLS